ncbi:putative dimethylaniline monooxygenase [Diaporthe ampelina]|uniref:Putative dimethylaniline monooxygenase n=1 Tax=Diaporthe ampelina TaxID=1214573 RepID=A0A0G2FJG7_9PEZI|nr:putative dimethylaniline monooxygenase [Diaporthe ampelina]
MPAVPGLNTPLPTPDEKRGYQTPNQNPGASLQPGIRILHASDFKTRSQFGKDKTVLILGVGETAMDIAHLAITSPTKRVVLSHRDGFISSPKIVPDPLRAGGRSGGPDPAHPNKPLDCATASLFDTAYVPPAIQRGPWLWAAYDAFVTNMAWAISGTRAGFDQWAGGVGPARLHTDSLLICKSDRALPYISEQYRSQSRLNRWRTWLINVELRPTGGRRIDLAPWPTHVDERGVVHFEENERPESMVMREEKGIRPDVVIFATGYKQSFPFVPKGDAYPSLDDSVTRGIFRNVEDGIAYIGFIRPAFGKKFFLSWNVSVLLSTHLIFLPGAIPPVAELQAQHWVYHLVTSPKFRPSFSPSFKPPRRSSDAVDGYEMDYKLKSRDKDHDFAATKRGVDQESYVYQLALDMGSAPTWTHVLGKFGREVFFTWAMGPNFPTKFRLVGPWANGEAAREAAGLMRRDGELGKLVRRTGGGVFFFTYTIIPLVVFAPISIFINTLCWCLRGIGVHG